jgi:hypothetical protein
LLRRGRSHLFDDLDPAHTALVVIDMQSAFCAPGGPAEVVTSCRIFEPINKLTQQLRALNVPVIWVLHYPTRWKRNFSVWQAQQADMITKFAKYVAADLARIDFKKHLVQSVLLFQEGLETGHIDIALLKFWTGIELLCAKEERESTERVARLCAPRFGWR